MIIIVSHKPAGVKLALGPDRIASGKHETGTSILGNGYYWFSILE